MKKIIGLLLAITLIAASAVTVFAADAAGFTVEELGDNVDMHLQVQTEGLEDYQNIRDHASGTEDFSAPKGVDITWTYEGEASEGYLVKLSEHADMADAVEYTTTENSCNIKNLYLGKTYYYTISAGEATSDIYSFTTGLIPPRNLYIDGTQNIRDLGGWETDEGKHVKQGMLYRSSALFTEDERYTSITEDGIEELIRVIAPKTEIDVRGAEETWGQEACPAGGDSVYVHIPMESPFRMKWDDDTFHAELKEVFSLMADESNYPIIYHCAVGTDRTGFISCIVLGILGVSQEDILRDYVFSTYSGLGTLRDDSNLLSTIMTALEPYNEEGTALKENCRAFLLDIGITEEEIDSIVNIMTVD